MKIQVTVEIDSRTPAGWSTPGDADEISSWLRGEWEGLDVEDEAVSFEVLSIETQVLAP